MKQQQMIQVKTLSGPGVQQRQRQCSETLQCTILKRKLDNSEQAGSLFTIPHCKVTWHMEWSPRLTASLQAKLDAP